MSDLSSIPTDLVVDIVATMSLEWGSPEQIEAQNNVFLKTEELYGIDWEQHNYLMKATTEEMMTYVMLTLANKRLEQARE